LADCKGDSVGTRFVLENPVKLDSQKISLMLELDGLCSHRITVLL
jgi:hypothetical protein